MVICRTTLVSETILVQMWYSRPGRLPSLITIPSDIGSLSTALVYDLFAITLQQCSGGLFPDLISHFEVIIPDNAGMRDVHAWYGRESVY